MTPSSSTLDVVVIAGDLPLEVLGKEVREKMRLAVDGVPATLSLLRAYFQAGRDTRRALDALRAEGLPFVSLNGPYLCQYLERRGFSTRLVPFVQWDQDGLVQALRARPRAVAISTTFMPFAAQIDALAEFSKQHAPETLVVAGGPQVWKSFKHLKELEAGRITEDVRAAVCAHNYLLDPQRPSPVDALVVSPRGEATLAAILEALRAGRDWRGLDNVGRQEGGRWRLNRLSPEPDEETRVDWRRHAGAAPSAYYPVQAGQGCAYRCAFCDFCGLFPQNTLRPIGSIIEEIGTIPERNGVRRVYFTDDNLFPHKKRIHTLCAALLKSGMTLRWRGMLRVSLVDEELAEMLARSGCLEVLLGVESGDAGQLRRMNKHTTPDQILRGLEVLTRHGISTKSTFIVGYPGETQETLRNTVELLNAYPTDGPAVHRYLFFTFAVLPLSAVAAPTARAQYGLQGYGFHWRHATMDSEQAAEALAGVQAALKPELSPSYILEVPELDGLGIEEIKRVYRLRNQLARARQDAAAQAEETGLWAELEGIFHARPAASG